MTGRFSIRSGTYEVPIGGVPHDTRARRWSGRSKGSRDRWGRAVGLLFGKKETSKREGFPAYVADRLTAAKWRNGKMHLIKQDSMYDVPEKLPLARIGNLLTDRREERDVGPYNTWVTDPMLKIVAEFGASLKKYPPIKLGTPDPYTPPQ